MNPFLALNVKANPKDREQKKDSGIPSHRPNPLGSIPTNVTMESLTIL